MSRAETLVVSRLGRYPRALGETRPPRSARPSGSPYPPGESMKLACTVSVVALSLAMLSASGNAQSAVPTSSLPPSALPKASAPGPIVSVRSQVGPAAAGGTVYYTDSNSSTSPTSFYAYDVATDSWTTKASLPSSNSTQLTTDEVGRVYALIDDGNI